MFERFTERARQVVVLAQEEARILKHNYIGTEHILLGLLREEEGLAARVLESLDITVERVRAQVVRIVGSGEVLADGLFPLTPRCRTVLEHALQVATRFGHGHIGTEHLLIGLVREREGVAARILVVFDVDPDKVRSEVVRMLARPDDTPRAVDELKPPADSGDLAAGASRLIEPLARPIEGQLGRPADAGDLLVALASIPEGLVGRALAGLGIGPEVLSPAVDEARRAHGHTGLLPPSALTGEIDTVRKERFAKLAAQHFEEASELRQRERQLVDQARELEQRALDDALAETRKRLGLTG